MEFDSLSSNSGPEWGLVVEIGLNVGLKLPKLTLIKLSDR